MAALLLFAKNILETSTLTVTSEVVGKEKAHLVDRDRGPQWEATSAAQQDLDFDQGVSPSSWSHVAFVGYAIGSQVEVYRGAAFPPATLVTTLTLAGDPYLADLGAVFADRYGRLRILAGASAPKAAEVFVGVPRTITRKPQYGRVKKAIVGNVARDESRAGYSWTNELGDERIRVRYGWGGTLSDAELTELETAFREIKRSAKKLIVRDIAGAVRWMEVLGATLESDNVSHGRHAVELELLEAL